VIALLIASFLAMQAGDLAPFGERVMVLLFVRTDCPISNRYAPEIQRIERQFHKQGVAFQLVYPEKGVTEESIELHRREYRYSIPGVADPKHLYVARAGVHVTPEAAVFVRGRLVYRGRIDNQYVSFGQARSTPSAHDLEDALAAVVAGHDPRSRRTEAVGCAIEPLR
jgi:hypothetical protein